MTVLIGAHAQVTPNARFGVVADGTTSRPMTLLGIEITLYPTLADALHDFTGTGVGE